MHNVTTSLYICFSLPLIPTADQLTTQGWSLEHGMPAHDFYCPHVIKQALSSCTPLKFTFNLQLSKSWLPLFCRIPASPPSPTLPPSSDHRRAMQDAEREWRNMESVIALDWQSERSRNADAAQDGLRGARKGVGSASPNFLLRVITIKRFFCLFLLSHIQ